MLRALTCLLLVALAVHTAAGYDINDILADHESEDLLFQEPISTGAPQALAPQRTLLQETGGGGVYSPSPVPSPPISPPNSPAKSPPKSPPNSPIASPKASPKLSPAKSPKLSPAKSPKLSPAKSPKLSPAKSPPKSPKKSPAKSPKKSPAKSPKKSPAKSPKKSPAKSPKKSPAKSPKKSPKKSPRKSPTKSPKCLKVTPPQRSVVSFIVIANHNRYTTYGAVRDTIAGILGLSGGDIDGPPSQFVTGGRYDIWVMSISVKGFNRCPLTVKQAAVNTALYETLKRSVDSVTARGIMSISTY